MGTYENAGYKPLEMKFLEPNYLFAIGFREGWIFGRVIRRRQLIYKPYKVIDNNGNAITISASSYASQGPLRFRDPRNTQNSIVYLNSNVDNGFPWILHGGFGVKPDWINVYLRYPEAQGDVKGKFPNIDPVVPNSGDDTGYINGLQSPYHKPTDFSEFVMIPKIQMSAEYYNKDPDFTHQPVLNLMFNCYWFQVLNRTQNAELISDIATRRKPASFLNTGFDNQGLTYTNDLQNEWRETVMTLDEAAALSGNGPSSALNNTTPRRGIGFRGGQ